MVIGKYTQIREAPLGLHHLIRTDQKCSCVCWNTYSTNIRNGNIHVSVYIVKKISVIFIVCALGLTFQKLNILPLRGVVQVLLKNFDHFSLLALIRHLQKQVQNCLNLHIEKLDTYHAILLIAFHLLV